MKTFIVLIPVSNSVEEPRRACELIEATKFNCNPVTWKVLDKILHELGLSNAHNIEVETISDFMDRLNNEELNPDNYFMSYVYV